MAKTIEKHGKSYYKHVDDLPIKRGKTGMVATAPLKMIVPMTYKDRGLWTIDGKVTVFGNGIIVDERGGYKVLMIPTVLTTDPDDITHVEIDGEIYLQMEYEIGDVIYHHDVEYTNNYIYPLFELYIIQGRIPFYMDDIGIMKLMSNIEYYSGAGLMRNSLPIEAILSVMSLNSDGKPYRLNGGELKMVGMKEMSVISSNMAKVSGAYMKAGITSSIVNENNTSSNMEDVVRS